MAIITLLLSTVVFVFFFPHHTVWLIEMYMVIYLFCKLAFPQLTTFLIFYKKRHSYLSYLLIWSHFSFPILLLKTVVRYWNSSCLGEEYFPMEQCPLLVTGGYLLLHDVIFSPSQRAHKGFGRFHHFSWRHESRGRLENTHSFKKLLQLIDITGFQIRSAHQWHSEHKRWRHLYCQGSEISLWPLFTPESWKQPELCLLVSVSFN